MNSKIEAKDVELRVRDDKIEAKEVELSAKEDEIRSISRRIKAEEEKKNEQIAGLHNFIVEAENRGPLTNDWKITRAQIRSIEKQKIDQGAWGGGCTLVPSEGNVWPSSKHTGK